MQKEQMQKYNFFKFQDGSEDNISMMLYCYEAAIYNIFKNITDFKRKVGISLFLKDINPLLWQNDTTGAFRITNLSRCIQSLWPEFIKINEYIKKDDSDAISFLESLLDQGQFVILQTPFQYLKYFIRYDPHFDMKLYQEEQNHVVIVLHHEGDKVYFVDKQLYLVRAEYDVPFELNSQISVIQKSELALAINKYMKCSTLELSSNLWQNHPSSEEVINFIEKTIEGYPPRIEKENGYTRYFGAAAYEKLLELCNSNMDLTKYFCTVGRTLQDCVAFDIWMLHGSRLILWEYFVLLRDEGILFPKIEELIKTLDAAIKQWKIIETAINRQVMRNCYVLNQRVGKQVAVAIEIEKNINSLLIDYCKFCRLSLDKEPVL